MPFVLNYGQGQNNLNFHHVVAYASYYEEVIEDGGGYTYYYHSNDTNKTIVITYSKSAGYDAIYNDNGRLRKLDCINRILQDKNYRVENFFYLSELFRNDEKQLIFQEIVVDVVNKSNSIVVPYGLTDSKNYFIDRTGAPYNDRIVASKIVEGKNISVYESKNHEIYEINRVSVVAGETLSVLLAAFTMPKSVAIGLGIAVLMKEGVEVIKYLFTVLKYNCKEIYYKDITVNRRSCHEVQRRYIYTLWEKDNNYELRMDFGDEDQYFSDNSELIKIALKNYF